MIRIRQSNDANKDPALIKASMGLYFTFYTGMTAKACGGGGGGKPVPVENKRGKIK